MKTTLIAIFCLIAVGVGIFLYKTRPYDISTDTTTPEITTENETSTEPTTDKVPARTLQIIPSESQVRFSLNEKLNGKPVLVIGTTNAIEGNISIDPLGIVSIGAIRIDARTFKTDNERRNGAIVRMILKSDQSGNEYITFKPTTIGEVPEKIIQNTPFSYTITGDLSIQKTTREVTFEATSVLKDDGSFTGTAKTTLDYTAFGITVPELSFLADVEEKTMLEIAITAR